MAQKGTGRNQVGTGVGVVEGDLSDSHFSGTKDLNLRILSIFQGKLIKKLHVPSRKCKFESPCFHFAEE